MVYLLVLSVPSLSSLYGFSFLWCKTAYVVLNFNLRGVSSLRLHRRFIHFHFPSHEKISRPKRCYWMFILSLLIWTANFNFHLCVGLLSLFILYDGLFSESISHYHHILIHDELLFLKFLGRPKVQELRVIADLQATRLVLSTLFRLFSNADSGISEDSDRQTHIHTHRDTYF